MRERSLKRSPQVVMFHVESRKPCYLVGAGKMRLCFFCHLKEEPGMPLLDLANVGTLSEFLRCILTDGLEHEEPRLATCLFLPHQALVYQRCYAVQHIHLQVTMHPTYSLHSFESAATDKDR